MSSSTSIAHESVYQIVKKVSVGELNIPVFQRDFKWKAKQVMDLAESLYREYPIGMFLFWSTDEEVIPKTTKKMNPTWIVDGQQRISSLCILFGEKPYWWPSSKEWETILKKYDVMINMKTKEIKLASNAIKSDPKWISFREVLCVGTMRELDALAKKLSRKTALGYGTVYSCLQRIYNIKNYYKVPTLTVSHTIADVVEVFSRINKKGTKVDEADIIKGFVASVNQKWIKNHFEAAMDEWSSIGWKFDPIIVLRTISGIGTGKTILKDVKNDFWKKRIDRPWVATKNSINSVIMRLKEYGISSIDLIPSKNSLVPVFILYDKFRNKRMAFSNIVYWLLLANYTERYSGSALYTIQKDVNVIKKSKSFKEAINGLMKNIEADINATPKIMVNPSMLRNTKYTSSKGRFFRLLMYMIMFNKGARDWISKTKIGYEQKSVKILNGFSPEWHHIFPKNILKAHNVPGDMINSIANITVITSRSNKKFKMEPWKYIWDFNINNTLLREHMIPREFKGWSKRITYNELKSIWSVKQYDVFLQRRSEILSREMRKYIANLVK